MLFEIAGAWLLINIAYYTIGIRYLRWEEKQKKRGE